MNTLLLILSLFFYAWGEPSYVILLVGSLLLNYYVALFIEFNRGTLNAKFWLYIGIIVNILLLIYFKYINFFLAIGLFNYVIDYLPEIARPSPNFNIALPLGISFYTFQAISYLIDIHRGITKAARSPVNFGCYLTMFPQLIAGPIVRYSSIAKELEKRTLNINKFSSGIKQFIFGLSKKMLIADTCGKVADAAFAIPNEEISFIVAWAGICCYTLQIYFDFSGYSDMAIGIGRMFGFTFPENFNYPYISRSIKEFWRRWHITLGLWFRDYLYIPMGGNRNGIAVTCLNLLIVFTLCGFWHGADLIFLLWGMYHGIFLIIERIFKKFFDSLPRILGHIYAICVFTIGWLLFRSSSIEQFVSFLKGLFGGNKLTPQTFNVCLELFSGDVYIAISVGILLSTPIYPSIIKRIRSITTNNLIASIMCSLLGYGWILLLLLICLLPLYGSTYNSFIYFRF
ncbi:MBOAT family O-acyltransferase [Succinimonas sp.]|uniref:MBOAT family O-acyltransferase n=1 Tax=Succinimonas sp. TaxID=1936151 RepID=UPI003863E5FF